MKVLVVTGSRADYGMLEWPIKMLKADPFFAVEVLRMWGESFVGAAQAFSAMVGPTNEKSTVNLAILLGDRFEILACATVAHLKRIPIAHIGGGDVTEGSYDDAMRDCISRMATIHFVTSTSAMSRLCSMGIRNVHLVGSPGIDYIRHTDWKKVDKWLQPIRPYAEPYVVVSYQAETIDEHLGAGQHIGRIFADLPEIKRVIIRPNPDRGSDLVNDIINGYERSCDVVHDFLPHAEFLNLIYHCEEFIGNSSAMLYEAPELGIKTRMIGKRQRGRTIPWGDGNASERIVHVLKYGAF